MAFAAALLDELMGRNRNLAPNDELTVKASWWDSDVCKYYLCGFCPHDLFTNTRADLGFCSKVHDDELRRVYVKSSRCFRMGYEEEFLAYLQSLVGDVDKRISRGHQRLQLNQAAANMQGTPQNSVQEKSRLLTEKINELVEQAEKLGCEGKVEEAQGVLKLCDQLRLERQSLQESTVNQMQPKEMEVCPVCGAFLVVGDAPQRVEDHLNGKQHVGFARCRSTIEELKKKLSGGDSEREARLQKEREEREKEKQKEREREQEREAERVKRREREEEEKRDREKGKEREKRRSRSKSKRSGSRSHRSGSRARRSRSRRSKSRERRGGRRSRSRDERRRSDVGRRADSKGRRTSRSKSKGGTESKRADSKSRRRSRSRSKIGAELRRADSKGRRRSRSRSKGGTESRRRSRHRSGGKRSRSRSHHGSDRGQRSRDRTSTSKRSRSRSQRGDSERTKSEKQEQKRSSSSSKDHGAIDMSVDSGVLDNGSRSERASENESVAKKDEMETSSVAYEREEKMEDEEGGGGGGENGSTMTQSTGLSN